MTAFNIIILITIILVARLGIRLYIKWRQIKNDEKDQEGPP